MKSQLDYLGTALAGFLNAEEALLSCGAEELAEVCYDGARQVMAAKRAEIEMALASPADVSARRAQLEAAIELDGLGSSLAAKAARRFAGAARRFAKAEAA